MTDSDGTTVVVIPPEPQGEPVIVAPPVESAGEEIAEAISEVAEIDRMLDHETRIATLEATLSGHTHPEYEQPAIAPEPIIEDIPAPPPEPDEIGTPEVIEDSRPSRSHPLFARPFGGNG